MYLIQILNTAHIKRPPTCHNNAGFYFLFFLGFYSTLSSIPSTCGSMLQLLDYSLGSPSTENDFLLPSLLATWQWVSYLHSVLFPKTFFFYSTRSSSKILRLCGPRVRTNNRHPQLHVSNINNYTTVILWCTSSSTSEPSHTSSNEWEQKRCFDKKGPRI